MNRASACRASACAALVLLACAREAPPAGPTRIGELWTDELRAVVEQEFGPDGARITLILIDEAGREAELPLQSAGRRWDRAVFTHDENQQWFLHPVSEERPPAVFFDFVFDEIRVGDQPKLGFSALPWRTVEQPRRPS